MSWLRFFHRAKRTEESLKEIQFYLDIETEQNMARGMSPQQARTAAYRKLGNSTLIREDIYRMHTFGFLETPFQDLRYAFRTLAKDRGFTVSAALALAVGIGVNVALFSVINSVLLRPLPYPSPNRLVRIWKMQYGNGGLGPNPSDFLTWRAEANSFSGMAAYLKQVVNFSGRGYPEPLTALCTTPDFFSVLGVKPALGRFFTSSDLQAGDLRVAVISHRLWMTRLAGSSQALGASTRLNGESYLIVGILQSSFTYGTKTPDVYLPLVLNSASPLGNTLSVIGRLKPGVTRKIAQAELSVIAARVDASSGESSREHPGILRLKTRIVGDVGSILLPLFGAVGCVLLIGCSTLASLLLARATTRKKEMAVRAALGASRWRLLRQTLTESVVLALIGGLGGVAVTQWLLVLLRHARPKGLPRVEEISIDPHVLGFALLLSIVTGLVFGLAPALRTSHVNLGAAMKEGRESGGRSRQRLRNCLVVGEVALSLVLLICAGLLLNSFVRLVSVNLGFRADHVLTMRISLPQYSYRNGAQMISFYQQATKRITNIPGVVQAGIVNFLPLARKVSQDGFNLRADSKVGPAPDLFGVGAGWKYRFRYLVSPGFFDALGIRLLRGRMFTARDNRIGAPPVVIVNQKFAHEFLSGRDPIGTRLHLAPSDLWCTIIGVSEDTKSSGLGDNQLWLSKPPVPAMYLPYAVLPAFLYNPPWNDARSMSLAVRTTGDPLRMVGPVRRAISAVNPNQAVTDIETMDQRVMDSVAVRRLGLLPVLIFAVIAMLLAMSGIYGLVAYTVAQRTREIGIRMALGASRADVLLLTMRDSVGLALTGVVIGVAGGLAAARILASQLFGISATDPVTYAAVIGLLLLSAILASYIPARRATSVDPMIALHYE